MFYIAMNFLLVFFGGGLGAALRHAANQAAVALFGASFPIGTLLVNVTGSAAMGLFAGWLALRSALPPQLSLFLTTGFLGGFTTFSAFSLDTVALWERGDHGLALAYAVASVLLSISGLVLGWTAMRAMA